jgi:catechol 2,3-dioxygenase-like lactoylglutathione lyase family enzyme
MSATVTHLKQGLTLAMGSSDRQASAAWYARHLGFTLLYDVPEIGWCEMATHMDGVTVGFAETFKPTVGNCVPTWEVEDLDAARAALEAAGVAFDGPTEVNEGMVKLATFHDLDGNAMMLSEALMAEG